MRKANKELVMVVVECDGFDYAFAHGNSFKNVKDEKFHLLRAEFLRARKRLQKYIGVDDV